MQGSNIWASKGDAGNLDYSSFHVRGFQIL